MNPNYGVIAWIVIGALAGWVSGLIIGTHPRQGALMNVVVGVLGAIFGGFLTRGLFNDYLGDNGLLASFAVALFGSCTLLLILRLAAGGRSATR